MTPLGRKLAERITRDGPITVAAYMSACLGDLEHGYYRTRDPLGAAGDFVTAPEVSQMFGELLGLWAAQVWETLGRPHPVMLAELGPGRGSLIADALRAVRKAAPEFVSAVRLHLVEINEALRAHQQAVLADMPATWHEDYSDLPNGPMLLLANEFLDALPVRQFVHVGHAWRERLVGFDALADAFVFVASPASATVQPRGAAPEGSICEVCTEANALARWLSARLRSHRGAALFLDYGAAASGLGDTLQAVRRQRRADPLEAPGEIDLTAHVDFQAFAETARNMGSQVQGPVPQGVFLRRLGIDARAVVLLQRASAGQAAAIEDGYRTLIDGARMGTLFKALAVADPSLPTLPGFDPDVQTAAQDASAR
jgi:NADH dehydrogenase [ubiquinone] 1 alpha subcomplex assembly factor 7